MCIGIPMQVVTCQQSHAICDNNGQQETVDMALTGAQPAGTWVLVFLGAAREVITESRAQQVQQALAALQGIQNGTVTDSQQLDALFADLVAQEPQLPPHLRPEE